MTNNGRELRPDGQPLDGASLDAARAWVDRDLGAAEAAAFEGELQTSASLQDSVARAKAMRALFAELPRFVTPAAIREDLRDRLRDGRDRVAREVRALPRFNAPNPVRAAVMRQVREAAAAVYAEQIAAGQRAGVSLISSASADGAIHRGRSRVRALPLRFLVAASVLLATSAVLLAGGRRVPVRPAGALSFRIEFAQVERAPSRQMSAPGQAPEGRSRTNAPVGGSR